MHLNFLSIIVFYSFIMNIAGLAVIGIDKSRAKRHVWRIPEATLFLVSLLGGSIGTWGGMYLFRHKTKHWYFWAGFWGLLLVQTGLGLVLRRL